MEVIQYRHTQSTLAYYLTLTITLGIHGISNMEVLTSNDRMSAITIFSLYLRSMNISPDHLCEEGPAEFEEIGVPFSIILLLFSLLTISYVIHFNGLFLYFWTTSQDYSQDTWNLDNNSGCNILLVFYFTFQL